MKRFKTFLLFLCCAAFCVTSALFAVACNDSEKNDDNTTTEAYTVTLDYNKDQGTVTLSPAANSDGKYAKDTNVTVTVTAKTDFEVNEVKVGDTKVDLVENKYTFKVTSDVTVTATFKDATPTPPPAAKSYTVTLSYEALQGTVKLSPAADSEGKYAEGTDVTVEVTPKTNYAVDEVKVGDTKLDPVSGKYTFKVTADVTVTVTFKTTSTQLPDVGVTFAESWQGTWKSQDNAYTLVVGTNTMSLNDTAVTAVTGGTEGEPYAFSVGGKSYTLEVSNPTFSASSLLTLKEGTKSVYLAHSFTSTIEEKYVAHWYATNSDVEMEVTASEITYDGVKATFVVDAGHFESFGTGSFVTPVNAHVYLFLVGTEIHVLYWSDPYVTVDDTDFSQNESSYVAPEEALGEYDGLTNAGETFSIAHTDNGDVVKYNNTVVIVDATGAFKLNGKDYSFTSKNNILTLFTVEYDPDTELVSGQTSAQFVKKDVEELTVVDQDLLSTSWVCADSAELTVSPEGKISIGGPVGKIVYKEEHNDEGKVSYSYTVVVGKKVYDVFKDTETTLYVEDYDGFSHVYGNGKIDASYNGTYRKNASGTVGSVISIANNTFTFDGKVYPLISAGVGGGYNFTVTDTSGASTTYTISLLFGFENYLLSLSYTQYNSETAVDELTTVYYLKDAKEFPSVTMPADMVGAWGGGASLVDVYETTVFIGQYKGQVFADKTDSEVTSFFVYANGDLYQVLYENGQLTLRNYGSDDAGTVYTTKTAHPDTAILGDKYKGTWVDDKGNKIVVDDRGYLFYNGDSAILTETNREDYYTVEIGLIAWELEYLEDGRLHWFNSVFDNHLYFTKLNEVHMQILQWYTANTLTKEVKEGSTVVVKGLFSGCTKGWNGFVVDINVNNAWYRLRMDPAAFGLNSANQDTNTWAVDKDAMYNQLVITNTWDEAKYLKLYENGGKAWVVTEATLLNNKLTYVVKTYAGTDSDLETVITTTTFELTSTSPVKSLNVAYYFDNDGNTVALEEAYADETVRHAVTVTCSEGSYELTPNAVYEKYYEEGTTLVLVVTAPEGKVIDQVTVNGTPVQGSGNIFKITVEEDSEIAVTFKTAGAASGIFSAAQQGTYSDTLGAGYDDTVTVSADKIVTTGSTLGDHTFTGITDKGEGTYEITDGTVTYEVTFQADGSILINDNVNWTFSDVMLNKA